MDSMLKHRLLYKILNMTSNQYLFKKIKIPGRNIPSAPMPSPFHMPVSLQSHPRQVILDLSYRFIPMDRVQKGSKSASEALVPKIDFENGAIIPGGHSETRTNNELAQMDV